MIKAKNSNGEYVNIEDIKAENAFEGTSPVTFQGTGENLINYRIYGSTVDGESVGNLVETGEHTGEYLVPMTVNDTTTDLYLPEPLKMVGDKAEYVDFREQKQHRVRKNLLQNTATSKTINGVTFTVNVDGSVTCNTDENGATATAILNIRAQKITLASNNYILSGCPIGDDIYAKYKLDVQVYGDGIESWLADSGNGVNISSDKTITVKLTRIVIYTGQVCNNLTFYPMIRKADISDDTYEPYIEDTELDVTLPTLSTLSGTNTLSVETTVQPSKIWGKIEETKDIEYIKDNLGNTLYKKYKEIETEIVPMSFISKRNELKNYRIYGNTINNESVGDKTPNLWDEKIIQGGTNNSGIIVYGNSKRLRSDYISVESGETYTFTSNLKLRFIYSYNDNNEKVSIILDNMLGVTSYTFTVPDGASKIIITVMKREDNTEYDITPDDFKWGQLEKSSVATLYEPYGYKLPVKIEGKNLLQNKANSQIVNGINFTINDDNSITCNGVGTDSSQPTFFSVNDYVKINDYVILNGCPINGGLDSYTLRINNSGTITANDIGNGITINNLIGKVEIRIAPNYVCNNLTFYPMIRKVSINNYKYEPYHEPINTNLYLSEPLRKVGDEAEYVDYKKQKLYKVRKNLFDFSSWADSLVYTTHISYNITGNIITLNATSNDAFTFPYSYATGGFEIPVNPNTTYILSWQSDNNNSGQVYVFENGVLSSNQMHNVDNSSKKSMRFTTLPDTRFLTFQLGVSNIGDSIAYFNIQLELGSVITPYEPYIQNTELDATLPNLPTTAGTNNLSVGTTVQPSKVYLKGKITEIN